MVLPGNPAKRRTFLAISPPSDIVLDVARAVDPTDIEAARAALTKRANGVGGAFSVDMAASVDAGSILSRATADKAAANADPASKFKKFEPKPFRWREVKPAANADKPAAAPVLKGPTPKQ